jgi:CheY-like chemotaxis protein
MEKLETNTYDIILMDLQMPVMNGSANHPQMNYKLIIALHDVTTVDVENVNPLV